MHRHNLSRIDRSYTYSYPHVGRRTLALSICSPPLCWLLRESMQRLHVSSWRIYF